VNTDTKFFENLMRPEQVASALGLSVKTIYDWRYRRVQKGIPPNLFLKVNRILYLRADALKEWIASQNPTQQ
jgi:predicted DNA-binding transcriptional regulator AlpA